MLSLRAKTLAKTKFYLYDILTDSDMLFVNEYSNEPEPKSFFELSEQFTKALAILEVHPNDADARALANEALYGMNKLLILTEICNYLGIDPSDVVTFYYTPGYGQSRPAEGHLKYIKRWKENIAGGGIVEREEVVLQVVNLGGELANATINGDRACNGRFDFDSDDRYYELEFYDGKEAIMRAIISDCSYASGETICSRWDDPTIVTGYNKDKALEVTDKLLEGKTDEGAKGAPKTRALK